MLCYVEKEVESGAEGWPRAEAEMALVLWGHRLWRDVMPEPAGQGTSRAACRCEASCPKQGLLQGQGRGCCGWDGMPWRAVWGGLNQGSMWGHRAVRLALACWQRCKAVPAAGTGGREPYGVLGAVLAIPAHTRVGGRNAAALALGWL